MKHLSIFLLTCVVLSASMLSAAEGGAITRKPSSKPKVFARSDSARVEANSGPNTIKVLSNDIGVGLLITAVTQGKNGAVAIAADSLSVIYTPNTDYTGPDNFSYTTTDSNGATATGKVFLRVVPPKPTVIARPDFAHVDANTAANKIDVLANDVGTGLLIPAVSQAMNGTVAIAADSLSVTYTPNSNFTGEDHFSYTVTDAKNVSATGKVVVHVHPAKPTILAISDHARVDANSSATTISVLANDIGTGLTVTAISSATSGTVAIAADSLSVSYTPNANFVGVDHFSYTITNASNATATGLVEVEVKGTRPLKVFALASPKLALVTQVVSFFATIGDDHNQPAATFAWDFGDGSTGTGAMTTHPYSAAGTYTVTVTATAGTATAVTTLTVLVQAASGPVASFVGNHDTDTATAASFDGSASFSPGSTIAAYSWDFGDGTPADTSGALVTHTFINPGNYTVTLTVTDAANATASIAHTIEVHKPIVPVNRVSFFSTDDLTQAGFDALGVEALVDAGTEVIGAGTVVSATVAGVSFTGTLDTGLRDTTNPNQRWDVYKNLPAPFAKFTYVHFIVKNATLAQAFTAAGVVPGANLNDQVTVTIPVTVTVGATTLTFNISSNAYFFKSGGRFQIGGVSQ